MADGTNSSSENLAGNGHRHRGSDWERLLNIVCKWRAHFAAWQLGTRLKSDPEYQAVAHHRELSIIMRVEYSALTRVLMDKGIFTVEELQEAIGKEAVELERLYERAWPGVTAHDDGLSLDLLAIRRAGWMKNWKP